jgi:hypothetical protein
MIGFKLLYDGESSEERKTQSEKKNKITKTKLTKQDKKI